MAQRSDKWNARNTRNMAAVQRAIDELFKKLASEAALIASIAPVDGNKLFSFDNYPMTKQRVERLLRDMRNGVQAVVANGIDMGWQLGNDKNDALVDEYFGANVSKLSPEQRKAYYTNNAEAQAAFKTRRDNGLNLSDRVWRYSDQFKNEIEMSIDIGLGDGLDADELSRRLRTYLREPKKLFRRVKDKYGTLQLSKAAKAYHPGQGVYRSSYKNARRLAATETNIAYRASDYERYQQLDFVVGIRIELSNNHTLNGVPLYDICDELSAPLGSNATEGRGCYPKDFKFTGWHPLCRCTTFTILKTPEEMAVDNARIIAGKPLTESKYKISNVPDEFNEWIAANRERAKGWASMPYFVRDNPQYVSDFRTGIYSAAEKKFTRAYHTSPAMRDSLALYLDKKYPGIKNTEKAALIEYTRGDVADFRHLNRELMKNSLSEFNVAFSELLSSALSKLPTEKATVYRTIRLNKTKLKAWRQQAASKASVTFEGYTSTSDDLNVIQEMMEKKAQRIKRNETDVLLVIKSKTGHRIDEFSKFPEQREILFDKGVRLKFDGVSEVSGRIVFQMTEI